MSTTGFVLEPPPRKPYSIGQFVRELRASFADHMKVREPIMSMSSMNANLLDFDRAVSEVSKDLLDHLTIQGER